MNPQEHNEYLLNKVLDSTSKILAILAPMAEKFAKRRNDDSGPRGFRGMSRKRNNMGMKRPMKSVAKLAPVVSDNDALAANTSDLNATANITPTDDTPVDETPVDETPVDETPVNNNSQEGGSRKKNKKSKGKKSRRSRR